VIQRVALTHRTHYAFDRPVALSPHQLRLRPALHARATVRDYRLDVTPSDATLRWQQDPYGNWLGRLDVPGTVETLELIVRVELELAPVNPFDFLLDPQATAVPFVYPARQIPALTPYLTSFEDGPLLQELLVSLRPRAGDRLPTVPLLLDATRCVVDHLDYTVRTEAGVYDPEETLAGRRGSCRDSAWLLVHLLRNLGFAARFASGFLVQLAGQPDLLAGTTGFAEGRAPDADTSELHAWCEVYLPGAGWLGLDTTSGYVAGNGHVPLACTPHPADAAPVSGTMSPGDVVLTTEHVIERLDGAAPTP